MIKAVLVIGIIAIIIVVIQGEIENRQYRKNKNWWRNKYDGQNC